jgi:hypothetical protein
MPLSEAELLRRAQEADEHALGEIYDTYSQRVYVYAYRLSGEATLAQEVMAETFYRGRGQILAVARPRRPAPRVEPRDRRSTAMTDLADRLDAAVARRAARQRRPEGDLEPLLTGLDTLEALRAVPTLQAKTLAQGRQKFLAQARTLLAPVSPAPARRPLGWIFNITRAVGPKERAPMKLFLRLALVLILVFGGATATAFAAQDSLPAEPLYGVKLITEDLRLSLTADPIAEISLLTEFATRRAQEMAQLAAARRAIPAEVPMRLESYLAQALTLAASLNAPQPSLAQIRQMTEAQSRVIVQARGLAPDEKALELAEQQLAQARLLADLGLTDPARLREQMQGPGAPMALTSVPDSTQMPTMMATGVPTDMPTMGATDMPMPAMRPTDMPMPTTMRPTDMPMPAMRPTDMPMPTSMSQPTMGPTDMPVPTMMSTPMPNNMMSTGMPGGGMGGMP